MLRKISQNVWKFSGYDSVNIYYLKNEGILIDAGNRADRQQIMQFLGKVIDFNEIKKVIFTHLHYDHCGNFDLFPNAEFFASQEEIDDFKKDSYGTVLDKLHASKLSINLKPLPSVIDGLMVIKTQGHTRGSICLWYEKEKILFTGDTLFKHGYGRVDLPTSVPEQLEKSITKLAEYNYKILAPGHDY